MNTRSTSEAVLKVSTVSNQSYERKPRIDPWHPSKRQDEIGVLVVS